jgi:hypothetical protein
VGVMLQHAWSYCALCHDLLEMRLNKVTILEKKETGSSRPLTYDLHAGDTFWVEHMGAAFQTVRRVDGWQRCQRVLVLSSLIRSFPLFGRWLPTSTPPCRSTRLVAARSQPPDPSRQIPAVRSLPPDPIVRSQPPDPSRQIPAARSQPSDPYRQIPSSDPYRQIPAARSQSSGRPTG